VALLGKAGIAGLLARFDMAVVAGRARAKAPRLAGTGVQP
jgi:hypothetical protein